MKTLKATRLTTLSESKTGCFQVTRDNKTYCFGDCKEWAERFYFEAIKQQIVVKENDHAKIVYSENWERFQVIDKKETFTSGRPYSYKVSDLKGCFRWFTELTKARETTRDFTPVHHHTTPYNILVNA